MNFRCINISARRSILSLASLTSASFEVQLFAIKGGASEPSSEGRNRKGTSYDVL